MIRITANSKQCSSNYCKWRYSCLILFISILQQYLPDVTGRAMARLNVTRLWINIVMTLALNCVQKFEGVAFLNVRLS